MLRNTEKGRNYSLRVSRIEKETYDSDYIMDLRSKIWSKTKRPVIFIWQNSFGDYNIWTKEYKTKGRLSNRLYVNRFLKTSQPTSK